MVYVGRMRGIPHIVLQKPKQGITKDVIELMICSSGVNYEMEIEILTSQGYLDTSPLHSPGYLSVALPHSTGNPDNLYVLTETGKGSYHTTTTPAGLKPPVLIKVIFHRPPITGQN